jgi:hypothetical protein
VKHLPAVPGGGGHLGSHDLNAAVPGHDGRRFLLLGLLALVYISVFVALDGLRFPLQGDEQHFWPVSLRFSHSLVPTAEALRSYGELNTPLPFVLWGEIEYLFREGYWLPRLVHLVLSFVTICVVAWPVDNRSHRALAAVGVLICPYFLIVSSHLYTDLLAAFFSVFGVAAHLKRRYVTSALLFFLAIASRQYMVAFPLALILWELGKARRTGNLAPAAWLSPTLATLTLGGWYLFFGGFGPEQEITRQGIVTVRAATVLPRNSLYFLACVGLYFVLPRAILYRHRPDLRRLITPSNAAVGAALLLLFLLFPPLRNLNFPIPTMGYFDRALRLVGLPDAGRIAVFYLFALLALYGLRREPLKLIFLACNALLMMKAHIAWDKYAVPLLLVLWYLESRPTEEWPSEIAPVHRTG